MEVTKMTAKNLQDKTPLHNGVQMPWFGLGVFKAEEGPDTINSVKSAITNGYLSIDTAAVYQNEESVGEGIRHGLSQSGLKREELFITSKVWNPDLGYEETLAAYEASLQKLGLDYLDLYLIHWPVAGKYKAAWKALEELYKQGRIKTIGVSNFQVHHLEDLMRDAKIKPMVNQVELHPKLTQMELRTFCKQHSIQIEAWSPLMQGELLTHPELQKIAEIHRKSVAQVILRWDLQNGIITIPKSIKEHRIIENSDIFDFKLSKHEMTAIDGLNENRRVGPDPDNFDF
jgi:methylglyoxal/glyoxal reductase